nr:hypothetical protein [Tanacetum cinerariifolium]
MSSPNNPTSNIKDAFFFNFPNYTTASPGNISPDPLYNDANKPPIPPQDPITPLAILTFHNGKVYNDANKPPIPPQDPITLLTILTPSPVLPPSPLFDP